MPAKGGCGDCSYEEIEKSVDYMLNFKDPGPTGGWERNRTDVNGVAVRCITTLPLSHSDIF